MRSSLLALCLPLAACTWQTDLPDAAKNIHVDASRELLVTDIAAALAANRTNGALSFRRAMSALQVDDGAALRWLEAWSERLRDEGHPDRATAFDAGVTCKWLRATAANACDDRCGTCAARALSLDDAPFRLVAVTNRTDLSVMPDRAADGGEGRLVFALTDGPADDPSSTALPMTVIFEYAQVGTALDWSARWHALGTATDFPQALTEVTDRFVATGTIAQIRTADGMTGPMLMHQFMVDRRSIVASNVRNSPDWSRVDPDAMRAFADANGGPIADGTAVLPREWWASSSALGDQPPAWMSGVQQHDALVKQTCGGCHAQAETGFQIDPVTKRPSSFLVTEVARRTEWMQLALSGTGKSM